MSRVRSTSSEILPCVSKIRGRNSSPRCFLEVLLSLLRPPFVGSPLVCKSALLQYVGCTRVDYSNVGLDRFVSSRVEDDVRLESLLGFLAAQTRVLPRRHTVQASEAHEAALQHVVPRQFLRAVDGVR